MLNIFLFKKRDSVDWLTSITSDVIIALLHFCKTQQIDFLIIVTTH